ncbi:MAG: lipoyl synthase [Candidatus Melainabacteria bacterium]|nr:lipoyl synthase [Candidatus Melainabacteria bacterium]
MLKDQQNPFKLTKEQLPKLPKWLRNHKPKYHFDNLIKKMPLDGMTTVCHEAQCPNRGECISRGIVTVMILGSQCTRACTFCAVERKEPDPVDPGEAQKMLDMVNHMDAKYLVITAPTRDDLFDGGAAHFRHVVEHVRQHRPDVKLELLIPDFQNQSFAFDEIIAAQPDMLCFDIQTVKDCYHYVRPGFSYDRALELFDYFRDNSDLKLKSGIMLGVGETREQVLELFQDLYDHGVRYVTAGQYLQPPGMQLPVLEYVEPETYKFYEQEAQKIGLWIQAGPLVRSSYMADSLAEQG